VVAAQCARGGAVDLAGCGERGRWARSAAQDQHRQAPDPFLVPSGLHALRPDPHDAAQPATRIDGMLWCHAEETAAVHEGIGGGLKYEGSREMATFNSGMHSIAPRSVAGK